MELSEEEIERALARSRRMFQMDLAHSLAVAHDEGFAEGYAIGRCYAKGYTEGLAIKRKLIAKKMLADNMPVDEIIELTKLTREVIEGLCGAD